MGEQCQLWVVQVCKLWISMAVMALPTGGSYLDQVSCQVSPSPFCLASPHLLSPSVLFSYFHFQITVSS